MGPDASHLLDGHDRDFPFGPNGFGTPLDRLADEGGHIVLLGVNHRSNTIAHLIWYRAGIPLFEEWREVHVTAADGSIAIVRVRHPGCSLGFNRLDPILDDKGIQRKHVIGAAVVRRIKADAMIEAGLDAVKRDPFLLLCDTPDCRFCRYAERMLTSS